MCPIRASTKTAILVYKGRRRSQRALNFRFDSFVQVVGFTLSRFDSGSEDCITVFSTS